MSSALALKTLFRNNLASFCAWHRSKREKFAALLIGEAVLSCAAITAAATPFGPLPTLLALLTGASLGCTQVAQPFGAPEPSAKTRRLKEQFHKGFTGLCLSSLLLSVVICDMSFLRGRSEAMLNEAFNAVANEMDKMSEHNVPLVSEATYEKPYGLVSCFSWSRPRVKATGTRNRLNPTYYTVRAEILPNGSTAERKYHTARLENPPPEGFETDITMRKALLAAPFVPR